MALTLVPDYGRQTTGQRVNPLPALRQPSAGIGGAIINLTGQTSSSNLGNTNAGTTNIVAEVPMVQPQTFGEVPQNVISYPEVTNVISGLPQSSTEDNNFLKKDLLWGIIAALIVLGIILFLVFKK